MKNVRIIGISGPSGSGKTHIAKKLLETIGKLNTIIVHEDSYYRDMTNIPLDKRKNINFDHPNAFDHDMLIDHLKLLKNGTNINVPVYDYHTHTRTGKTTSAGPAEIIILEGILIFQCPELLDLIDLKVYIQTPPDICFIRRLKRDISQRGRTIDSVISQYLNTVRPMYQKFIETTKKDADIIIPGDKDCSDSIEKLIKNFPL